MITIQGVYPTVRNLLNIRLTLNLGDDIFSPGGSK
jgi:hypothetical protein